jgi:diguanylate cyclase (GGDEF)-like protein
VLPIPLRTNTSIDHGRWLQQRIETLYAAARDNERKVKNFQSFELALMACTSITEFLRLLLFDFSKRFDWDRISLTLCDPEFEIHRLFERSGVRTTNYRELQFVPDSAALSKLHGLSGLPRLGPFQPALHETLFPAGAGPPVSVALLPLVRERRLLGSLNLGSFNKERVHAQAATDFLQHLAAVMSVCLETGLFRERLKLLGLTDALTGVNNRRFFDQRLPEEIARVSRNSAPISCLFIDLDHFKAINDRYGHQIGDAVLREAADIIHRQVRTVDVVARYGGEEFAVLLAQTGNVKALEVAERIRRHLDEQEFSFEGQAVRVTASVGVATLPTVDRNMDIILAGGRLVGIADRAVYKAKAAGRNRVVNGNTEEDP